MELICLNWARMTHLDISNTSYGQKKGRELNWQFDSRPLKVGNCPDFLACRWHATYHWKIFDKGYNFALDLNRRSAHKIMGPQSHRSPNYGNFVRQNDMWVLVSWLGTKYTIRGKVVASPKYGSWWMLWVRVYSWFIRAPKCSNYALINLLFGLCRFVRVIELLVNLPNLIPKL